MRSAKISLTLRDIADAHTGSLARVRSEQNRSPKRTLLRAQGNQDPMITARRSVVLPTPFRPMMQVQDDSGTEMPTRSTAERLWLLAVILMKVAWTFQHVRLLGRLR